MKPFTILFLSILAAAGTSFLIFAVSRPSATRAEKPREIGADPTEALARSLQGLEKKQQDIEKTLEDLRKELAAQGSATRLPTGDIDAAVARALARHEPTEAPAKGEPQALAAPKTNIQSVFAKLCDPTSDWDDFTKACGAISDPAEMKELVRLFEERAKNSPSDAKAHVQLGQAYLQKLFKTSNPLEQGTLATLADKSFDRALAIDDHDWSARFNKATSMSHWPAMLGKQHETINQLEVLVKQQDEAATQPYHVQSHLLLGNMYSQIGEKTKALAAWQKGLALFPDSAELKQQIAAAQAH